MSASHERLNCIEIIKPYIEALDDSSMPPTQLLGGVGSVALLNEATEVKQEERRIIAPENLWLSNYREDGNLRDVETLVLSSIAHNAQQVENCAKQIIGNRLVVETFSLGDLAKIDEMIKYPFGFKALIMVLSDRYLEGNRLWEASGVEAKRVLFPFSTDIPGEALDTWKLEIGEKLEIPVPAPGAVVLNYLTRSISGLRSKDRQKVQQMSFSIFNKCPGVIDWIKDGPGNSQFEMARLFHSLREPVDQPQQLVVGDQLKIDVISRDQLVDHPYFLFKDSEFRHKKLLLELAKAKSQILHRAESIAPLVTFFQKHIEPRVKSIIHNQ